MNGFDNFIINLYTPQVFRRIVNRVMVLQYRDDFVCPDDDRGDNGDDGYIKSIQRLHAVHSFKKGDYTDAKVLKKAYGDLAKAVKLRDVEHRKIQRWAFITSYRLSDKSIKKIESRATQHNLEVDFIGPDHLADLIAKNPHQLKDIPEIAIAIQQVMSNPSASLESRGQSLERLQNLSYGRCIARWLAVGLSREEATQLAYEPSIGAPPDDVIPNTERPLVVIKGSMGAGKSLMGERLYQRALSRLMDDEDAPLPVWMEAKEAASHDLMETIIRKTQALGDIEKNGAIIIIDGADEAGVSSASKVLDGARSLTIGLPNVFIIITTRPILNQKQIEEEIEIPLLSEEASIELISIVKRGICHIGDYPSSIQEAIRSPFWAILLGIRLRNITGREIPQSTGELLRFLIKSSLPEKSTEVRQIFRRLARLSTDRDEEFISVSEIDIGDNENDVRKSGLILEHENLIRFTLPILTQWFAAESLMRGEVDVVSLAQDPERLDLWKYAIIIALGELSWERSSQLLGPIAIYDPGFASIVISESMRKYSMPGETVSFPPALEAGSQIREAAGTLIKGIEPTTPLLEFVNDRGAVHQLGVNKGVDTLTITWRLEDNLSKDVVEPQETIAFGSGRTTGWGSTRMSRPNPSPAWAWRWAHDEIMKNMNRHITKQSLPITDSTTTIYKELIWEEARAVMGKGSLSTEGISISELKTRLSDLRGGLWSGGRVYDLVALRQFVAITSDISLLPPHPGPNKDFPGGHIANSYSEEQVKLRTESVYEGALQGYKALVEQWFPTLAPRLMTYVKMPVVLNGNLVKSERTNYMFDWELRPLETVQDNAVNITYSDKQQNFLNHQNLDEAYDQFSRARPRARRWLDVSINATILHEVWGSSPSTVIAYDWLKRDLQRIGLLD